LQVAHLAGQPGDVPLARLEVERGRAAHPDVGDAEQPRRQAAEVPLGAGVRPGPEQHAQPGRAGLPDERGDVVAPRKIPLARLRLQRVPEDIGAHGVEAHRPGFEQPVAPVLPGDALEVQLARPDLERLPVQHELRTLKAEADGGRGFGRAGALWRRDRERRCQRHGSDEDPRQRMNPPAHQTLRHRGTSS